MGYYIDHFDSKLFSDRARRASCDVFFLTTKRELLSKTAPTERSCQPYPFDSSSGIAIHWFVVADTFLFYPGKPTPSAHSKTLDVREHATT